MTTQQRLVLIVSILATFLSGLDQSIVNVALPAIAHELGGNLATQQWITSAYAITLGALILVAGSLSDIFGRRRILLIGVIGFGISSVLCGVAPDANLLIIARAVQGIFGALLVPSSLAMIISSFNEPEQRKAIGTWTGWTGISFLVGPLLGGFLVDAASWRWIFIVNVIPTVIAVWLISRLRADAKRSDTTIDTIGATLATLGLAGVVFALIQQPLFGWLHPLVLLTLLAGTLSLVVFVWWERRTTQPMLPLSLFKIRNFSVGNLATVSIYAGLAVSTFLITIFVQQVGKYSALAAGMSILPVTIIMFFASSRFGALAGKYGPRFFMAVGPLIAAIGFALFLRVDARVDYISEVLPAVLVFGLGLSMTVAPLTAAVLGDIDKGHAGIGSAVNNAVARIAGLVAIASIGLVVGTTMTLDGFHKGIVVMVALLAIGGAISAIGIRNTSKE